MDIEQAPVDSELSAGKRYGLIAVALVIALLGLTTLDVAGIPTAKKHQGDERSAECIVASAVRVGVLPAR